MRSEEFRENIFAETESGCAVIDIGSPSCGDWSKKSKQNINDYKFDPPTS